MKKAILSVLFIGAFTWFGFFDNQTPTTAEAETRSGTIKRPIEW